MAYIRRSIYDNAGKLGMSEKDISKLSETVKKISKVVRKEERMARKQAELEEVLQMEAEVGVEADGYPEEIEERD